MFTLTLAQATKKDKIRCRVLIGGQAVIDQWSDTWEDALAWATAVTIDRPEAPPRKRTAYTPQERTP